MPFRFYDESPVARLVGLKSVVDDSVPPEATAWPVKVELRIYPYEIEDEAVGAVKFSFSEATLDLELMGLRVVPLSRWGEAVIKPTVRTVSKERVRGTNSAAATDEKSSVKGSMSITGAELGVDGSMGASRSTGQNETLTESEQVTFPHLPVKAVGDDQWIISSEAGAELNGVYLQYDALCEVEAKPGQNQMAIKLALYVKQRHVSTCLTEKPNGFMSALISRNQEALLKVLLTKRLHVHTSDLPFKGAICLARSEAIDEE